MKEIAVDIKVISPADTKTIYHEDGSEEEVSILIPICCREGWDDCPHVTNRKYIRLKRNIGL